MNCDLYMPYNSAWDMESEDLEDYYKTQQDYVDALTEEENNNAELVFNAVASDDYTIGNFKRKKNNRGNAEEVIAYSKVPCRIFSENGGVEETVDSVIDKFASRKPFLLNTRIMTISDMGAFEEEMSQWWKETHAILSYQKKKGWDWVNKYIPRKKLKLSFLNKSNKRIEFFLENVEIEEKINRNNYIFYIDKMTLIKN